MTPRSVKKKPIPKLNKVNRTKPTHPFSSAAVENAFYFIRTAPRLYSAIDYFKTFDPKTSDKQRLHNNWTIALQILLNSSDQQYFDQGRRLKLCWESPGNGLGTFWEELEDAKTASDIEDAARDNIRKHSIRSAERNILGAIHNLDDQSRSKKARLERKKSPGKENTDPKHVNMENGQGPHNTDSYAKSQDGKDYDTQDSEAQESQAAEFDASHASMHGPQEAFDNTDRDTGDDDLLSQKSTASECERSSLLSKGIYYLTGDGSKDCSRILWTPWIVNGQDRAPALWKYRKRAIDAAQRVAPLTSSVERLAVNHIYLFARNDIDSTLLDAVGLEDWRTVTSVTIEKGIEDTTVLELQRIALELSNLSHRESEELILSWDGDANIKKVLVGLVEDDFLWSSAPFNEHELLIHVFDPFLKAYICGVKGSIGRWDQAFPPSQNRKKGLDENSLGRRPDFMLKASVSGIVCYLFFVEAKKVRQGAAVVQDDLEKLAGMMKDAIDDMSKQGVNVGIVEVIGLHIVGAEGRLYGMKLEARGIYVLRSITVIYTPRSHFDFGVLATTINVLVHVQKRLEKTVSDIMANLAAGEQGPDWTRPGFHTPTRVLKT